MPELPEVETVRRDLCASICGACVAGVRVLCHGMLNCEPSALNAALADARIEGIARRGKALILRFSSGHSLIVHFRMTGQLYPMAADAVLPAHARTVFDLSDGRRLVHVDVRRLGTLELVPTEGEAGARTLAGIGPDGLDEPVTHAELERLLRRRKCPIKVFLLDQNPLSGIGNIYASEILADARLCPELPCCELSAQQVRRLRRSIGRVLQRAVAARGTTISDYRTGTGEAGSFQHQLRVYGRDGEACPREDCRGTIMRIVQAQRSTFYCPICQGRGVEA